jgi:hypothetical protein
MSMALSRFARYRTQARFFMPIPLCILSSDAIAPKLKIHGRAWDSWAGTGAPPLQLKTIQEAQRKPAIIWRTPG